MKKYPLILLISLCALTACQDEKTVEKEKGTVTTTTDVKAIQATEKTKVTQTTNTPPVETKKVDAEADEESSGVALHKTNCAKCHGANYYPKADSKMDSYKRLHTMVGMCDAQLGTELFPEELQSITDYLNDSFYKFKQ